MKIEWPVIGHKRIKNFLINCAEYSRIHSSYIFSGPDALGKRKTARYFLQTILCQGRDLTLPCGTCSSCAYFQKNIHPDHQTINLEHETESKMKKNIGILQIKKMQENLSRRPLLQKYKTVLVEDADFLSEKASNALLKTLEEPPQNSVIILIAKNLKNITETVRSRSQILEFHPVHHDDIYRSVIQTETDRDKAVVLTRLSMGYPGSAMEYLSNREKLEGYKQDILRAISLFYNSEDKLLIKSKSSFGNFGQNAQDYILNFFHRVLCVSRDALLMKYGREDLVQNVFAKDKIYELSQKISAEKILLLIKRIALLKKYLHQNVSPAHLYENFLLHI